MGDQGAFGPLFLWRSKSVDVAFGPANLGLKDEALDRRVDEALEVVSGEEFADPSFLKSVPLFGSTLTVTPFSLRTRRPPLSSKPPPPTISING